MFRVESDFAGLGLYRSGVDMAGEIPDTDKRPADRQNGSDPDGQDWSSCLVSTRVGLARDLRQLGGEAGESALQQLLADALGQVIRGLDDLGRVEPMPLPHC